MSEINILPSTPSTVVIDDDEATTSGISVCTSVSSYNSGDCGEGAGDCEEATGKSSSTDCQEKRQRRRSSCSAAELQQLTSSVEQNQHHNQQISIPTPKLPQTASNNTILNATPSAATIASVKQLKKPNLLSAYLRRIFHHCKVN